MPRGTLLLALGVTSWAIALAAVAVVGWFSSLAGDLGCPAETGDSNYGRKGWSRLPIGPTCTWTESRNGYDAVEGPGWSTTAFVVAGGAVGTGFLLSGSIVSAGTRGPRRNDDGS